MTIRERMKGKLCSIANVPRDGISDAQLDAIIRDVVKLQSERAPTNGDWAAATRRHVPEAGTYFYKGEDFSDLNLLLAQLLNASPGPRSGGGSTPVRK